MMPNLVINFSSDEWDTITAIARITGKKIHVYAPRHIIFDGRPVTLAQLQDLGEDFARTLLEVEEPSSMTVSGLDAQTVG